MKVIEIAAHGGPEVLKVVEKPVPEPGPDQVLVKVSAAGINFADIMSRDGTYPAAPKLPFTPGFEAAGAVERVGSNVKNLKAGDRIGALVQNGYAEYALVDSRTAAVLPPSLSYADATALLVQGMTALGLLTHATPGVKGKTVLVSAAAGGVGSLAIQLAHILGASTVIGLASSDAKRKQVRDLGAGHAIDYTQPAWAEEVKGATGGNGADVYLDASGDLKTGGLRPLAKGGTWLVYGAQSDANDALPMSELAGAIFGGQTIRGYSLYEMNPRQMGDALGQLIAWHTEGKLKTIVTDRFPLSEAAAAHTAISSRQTTGKVVLEP